MLRFQILLLALVFLAVDGGASLVGARVGTRSGGGPGAEPSVTLDEIVLKDGSRIQGRILSEDATIVVIETEGLGKLEIPKDRIQQVLRGSDLRAGRPDPDYNSIMLCPTPATLEPGDMYFRDYELFFLNFGITAVDGLDLSFGTLFPISGDVLMGSLGFKLRVLDREKRGLGLAALGNLTFLEDTQFGFIGGVLGVGDRHRSLNLTSACAIGKSGDSELIFMVGGDARISRRAKVFAEYANSRTLLEAEEDFKGFLNIGFRIFGDRMSFSLSGVRPLLTDEDWGLFAFPVAMFSVHW